MVALALRSIIFRSHKALAPEEQLDRDFSINPSLNLSCCTQRLKLFRPSNHSLTSTISPTVHTQASKHGGWKVSITHDDKLAMNTMGLRVISGTRDSPRARRASRRRRSTPSPERTGTQSRLVISKRARHQLLANSFFKAPNPFNVRE